MLLSMNTLALVMLPALVHSWEFGVWSTTATCTDDWAPDSNRAGDAGVTSDCQSFSFWEIKAAMTKDWDDGCRFEIFPQLSSCEGEPALTLEKGDGDAQGAYECIARDGYPDFFEFKYVCDD
ncbi:hypothetical protein EJ04DRAFT_556292 [Polyplosphaeria fusca]|uniref:Uncharacterized protein n=1 Tax=Polyplosphaeria fusca TaxID=682080 RepID=A0A9P4QQE2_9PLEO|nr:hypothetical protein EJ04DRAFT_556292 [Polyplosphaeria fusca]